jgi:hypothetical protein
MPSIPNPPHGINPGDEVRVFGRPSRYSKSPPDGYKGTITKVGRKYATATYDLDGGLFTIEFDMRDGCERGSVGTHARRVRTPAQVEQDNRREVALTAIRDGGLEFRSGYPPSRLTLEQLEALAEVVKTWDKEG